MILALLIYFGASVTGGAGGHCRHVYGSNHAFRGNE